MRSNEILDCHYCRMKAFVRSMVLSIQIVARDGGSIIAADNSIRIAHGDDFNNQQFSKCFSFFRVAKNEVQKPFHHI